RRRVEQSPGLRFEVGQHPAPDGFAGLEGTGVAWCAGAEGDERAESQAEAQHRAAVEAGPGSGCRGGGTEVRHGMKSFGPERGDDDAKMVQQYVAHWSAEIRQRVGCCASGPGMNCMVRFKLIGEMTVNTGLNIGTC